MPKRLYQLSNQPLVIGNDEGWSIGSNSLTPAGQSELLKHLGRQLQADYRDVLQEPAPDHIRRLLERLKESPNGMDEDG